eukprot:1175907-Prorocentrum_minimum.AAC.3
MHPLNTPYAPPKHPLCTPLTHPLQSQDRALAKLLVEAPAVTDHTLALVENLCHGNLDAVAACKVRKQLAHSQPHAATCRVPSPGALGAFASRPTSAPSPSATAAAAAPSTPSTPSIPSHPQRDGTSRSGGT